MKSSNTKKATANKPNSQSNLEDPSKGNKSSEVWNEINGKDERVKNKEDVPDQDFVLTEEDKTHFSNLSRILEKTEQKIVSVQREIDSNRDINNRQKELNEKANKAINNVKSNTKSLENDTLDQDIKTGMEKTIIEVYSNNQILQQKIEEMKLAFQEKNKIINSLEEQLAYYRNLCDEQDAKIRSLELNNKVMEKQVKNSDPNEVKARQIGEQVRGARNNEKVPANNPKYQNIQNDPYDFWKTSADEDPGSKKNQRLDQIIGKNANLWVLERESGVSSNNASNKY